MTYVSTPLTTGEPARKPGPSLKLSLGMIIAAIVVGAALAIVASRSFVGVFTSPSRATPAEFSIDAKKGTYAVYERTGTQNRAGNVTFNENAGTVLGPRNVTVTGPGGESIATRGRGSVNETLTRGSIVYTASVRFDTPTAGRYTVRVQGPATQVIVARTLTDAFTSAALAVIGVVLCGLLLVLGIILLIVGAVRRSRAENRGPVVPSPYPTGPYSGYPPASSGTTPPGSAAPGSYGSPGPYASPSPTPAASWPPAAPAAPTATPDPSVPAAPVAPGVASTAPGWYPDPWEPRAYRYYDGRAWTGHTSPRQG